MAEAVTHAPVNHVRSRLNVSTLCGQPPTPRDIPLETALRYRRQMRLGGEVACLRCCEGVRAIAGESAEVRA